MRSHYMAASEFCARNSPTMSDFGAARKLACKWGGCTTSFGSLEGLQQHMQAHMYETAYVEERNQSLQYGGHAGRAPSPSTYSPADAVIYNKAASARPLTPTNREVTNPLEILGHVASLHHEYVMSSAMEGVMEAHPTLSIHHPPADRPGNQLEADYQAGRPSSAPAAQEKGLHYFMGNILNVAPGPVRKGDAGVPPRRDGPLTPRGTQIHYNRSPYMSVRHDYVIPHQYSVSTSALSYTGAMATHPPSKAIRTTAVMERTINAVKKGTGMQPKPPKRLSPVCSDSLDPAGGENRLFDFCVKLSAMPPQFGLAPLN